MTIGEDLMKPYIIVELGQNHNGNFDIALWMTKIASQVGADAIKLTKRTPTAIFTLESYHKPYNSLNSFGKTYGKHREYLEFDKKQYGQISRFAHRLGLDFIVTVADIPAYEMVKEYVDEIKIGSADIRDMNLLRHIRDDWKGEIIVSTGLAKKWHILSLIRMFWDKPLTIFNCTCEYPTKREHQNLNRIKTLQKYKLIHPNLKIGHSDHSSREFDLYTAISMDIDVLEFHFTLDKSAKGSDHKASINVRQLYELMLFVNHRNKILGNKELRRKIPSYLEPVVEKLWKNKNKLGEYVV